MICRPGTKNAKPDALSRQFAAEPENIESETILAPRCMVSLVSWQIEQRVQEALRTATVPKGGPAGRLYVPEEVRSEVFQWGHASRLAGHPTSVTPKVLVAVYDEGHPTVHRSLHGLRTGKDLTPGTSGVLTSPTRAPSTMVTYLPESRGNTVLMTIVDCFSKSAYFVPLPKLPTAAETEELLVFWLHGIP